MLDDLLTEQAHQCSQGLDSLSIAQILTTLNAADAEVPVAVAQEIPRIAAAVEAITGALERGGHLVYLGAGTSGRLGVLDAAECPPTFNVPPELVRGIMAGGDRALSRAVRDQRRRPGSGRTRPADVGIRRRRCFGGDRRQRPHALRSGRGREGPGTGRNHLRHQLQPRLGIVAGRGLSHRTQARTGSPGRLDPLARGHRHQAGAQYDQHGRNDPARPRLRQPDGERPAQQSEADRAGEADHPPNHRRFESAGGGVAGSGREQCSNGHHYGEMPKFRGPKRSDH